MSSAKPPELFQRIKGIVTHSGQFHADEVYAVAYFTLCRGGLDLKSADIETMLANEKGCADEILLLRTRDTEELRRATEDPQIIVVDVGGEYDPAKNNYDHHQEGFKEVMSAELGGGRTTLSSFGLIFKHFWDLLPNLTKDTAAALYMSLVEGIDGHDNGIPHLKSRAQSNYHALTVGQVISRINAPDVYSPGQTGQFIAAVAQATSILIVLISSSVHNFEATKKSREIFERVLRTNISADRVLVIRERLIGSPATDRWLREAEADEALRSKAKAVMFIVTPRDPEKGNYSVWTRKKDFARFELVKPVLPAEVATTLSSSTRSASLPRRRVSTRRFALRRPPQRRSRTRSSRVGRFFL